jgi:hypothetical protein
MPTTSRKPSPSTARRRASPPRHTAAPVGKKKASASLKVPASPKAPASPKTPSKTPPKAAPKASPKTTVAATPDPRLPKPPKTKLVRDSFTMPATDFALIATLKERALAGRRETKKSELLRAGLQALAALDGPALLSALGRLLPLKVGRPKKHH